MLIISDMGLVYGDDADSENSPEAIENAICAGSFVKCDLWYHRDKWWLGRYKPQYQINNQWLELNRPNLFLQIKNYEALEIISTKDFSYVWYWLDQYTKLTNTNTGVTISNVPINNGIIINPEKYFSVHKNNKEYFVEQLENWNKKLKIKGVITTQVNFMKEVYESN